MPANIDPAYSASSSVTLGCRLTTAAADYDGTSTNNGLVWTAPSPNGGRLFRVRMVAAGTNVGSVVRFFLNNPTAGAHTTAANNVPIGQLSLPATTANASGATVDLDYWVDEWIPSGWVLYAGLGTTVAAGWSCIPFAGGY